MSELDWKTRLLHAVPGPFKNFLATLRGVHLEWLRRGIDFEAKISEAKTRESWGSDQWREYQTKLLGGLLLHARVNVPYYRDFWDSHPKSDDVQFFTKLENWPILEKSSVRANPELFVSTASKKIGLYIWHTSGSTGSPIRVVWSKKTMRNRWAVFEARSRRWYGVSHKDAYALIGGRMVVPFDVSSPPFWVWNAISRQLYMSSYHLSKENIFSYLSEIKRRNIRYIYAYTSSVYEIALFVLASPEIRVTGVKVIVTQAEPLYDYQRQAIERAFDCPVRESYGMAEMLVQAGECEHRRMHLWPEYGVVEVDVGNGKPQSYGTGDLIATGLLNWDMPLIRYRVGDIVKYEKDIGLCECGRTLPVLGGVEGRIDDVLVGSNGARIGRLSTVFKNLPLVEVQTIQVSLEKVLLKVVPAEDFTEKSKLNLIKALRERMGEIQVDVELVDAIPRGNNGKFKAVISMLAKE